MWFVIFLFFLAFVFFIKERSWKVHVAITSSFLTTILAFLGYLDLRGIYKGFSDNTIITVMLMLVMTGVLERSGIVELLVHSITNIKCVRKYASFSLLALVILASGVMNDIGALAIVMPVALVTCYKLRIPPSQILIALSYGALLGGLLTKVATPPNQIISEFREHALGKEFQMFDFTPVGIVLCLVGGTVILLLRKIVFRAERYQKIPEKNDSLLFRGYFPILITPDCKLKGRELSNSAIFDTEFFFPRFWFRGMGDYWECEVKKPWNIKLQAGDVLMIRVNKNQPDEQTAFIEKNIADGYFGIVTPVIQRMISKKYLHVCSITRKSSLLTMEKIDPGFRDLFHLLLLEVPKNEKDFSERKFYPGKVLTFLGERNNFDALQKAYSLDELNSPKASVDWAKFYRVLAIFLTVLLVSAFGIVKLELGLGLGVLILLAIKELDFDQIKSSIDIPLAVLIATMIVNAEAFVSSGAASAIANGMSSILPKDSPWIALSALIFISILLTNVMNNAACATIMAPIGTALAQSIGVSPDPFLMGVCVASSCAFLTPIGHQCNLLVYKAGDYDFSCYFKLGIWVTLAVWIAASIVIPIVWRF